MLLCHICSKVFSQKSALGVHMKRHLMQKDYSCYRCDFRSVTLIELRRHELTHSDESSYKCSHCDRSFKKDTTLRQHIRYVHQEREKQFHCSLCDFKTHRKHILDIHIKTLHNNDGVNFKCPVCCTVIRQRSSFWAHLRSHAGIKSHKCDICSKSFSQSSNLRAHKSSVHSERKFSCGNCSKVFSTKHHLIRHEAIHSNEKPFSCMYCNYSCNTKGNVTKHIRNVHNLVNFTFRKSKASVVEAPGSESRGNEVTEKFLSRMQKKGAVNCCLEDLKDKQVKQIKEAETKALKAKGCKKRKPEHAYSSCDPKTVFTLDSCSAEPSNSTMILPLKDSELTDLFQSVNCVNYLKVNMPEKNLMKIHVDEDSTVQPVEVHEVKDPSKSAIEVLVLKTGNSDVTEYLEVTVGDTEISHSVNNTVAFTESDTTAMKNQCFL